MGQFELDQSEQLLKLLTRVAHLPAVIRISSQGSVIAQCNSLRVCGADDDGCRDCAPQ